MRIALQAIYTISFSILNGHFSVSRGFNRVSYFQLILPFERVQLGTITGQTRTFNQDAIDDMY